MLAGERRDYHVELFQRDDAIKFVCLRNVRDEVEKQFHRRIVRQREALIDDVARPIFVQHLLFRHQRDVASFGFALAHEVAAFEKSGEANNVQRLVRISHDRSWANIQLCCRLVSRIVYSDGSFWNAPHSKFFMIFRGPYPDVTIPEVSLTDFIFSSFDQFNDKPALIDGPTGRVLTYRQFELSVRHVAAALAQRGFRKGDVFAIFSANCPEYAIVFHAVAILGGINTTLNPLYTAAEAATH